MSDNTIRSQDTPYYAEYQGDPKKSGQSNESIRSKRVPHFAYPAVISEDLAFLQIPYGQTGVMPDEWLLDKPGVSQYAGLSKYEKEIVKAAEQLFYTTFCMVTELGDSLALTRSTNLKGKKKQLKEHLGTKLEEITKKFAALRKKEKSEKANKIFRWLAVAVAAVIAAAVVVCSGGLAAGLAVALLAVTIAVAVMEETDKMKDLVKFVVNELQKPPYNCSKDQAEKIAPIVTAVVIAVVMLTLAIASGGVGASKSFSQLNNIRMAATIAQRFGEVAEAGVAVGQGVNAYMGAKANSDTKKAEAALLRINAITKDFQEKIQDILEDMEDSQEHIDAMKEAFAQYLQEMAATVKELLGGNDSGSSGTNIGMSR